jgi:2,4-dienoyl-CoA reductase (NADPH2)
LINKGVKMLADVTYLKVDDHGLHISIKDEEQTLNVDHIVVCAGQEPSRILYDELVSSGIAAQLIGGADEAAELDAKRAIHQACTLAAEI